MQYESEAEDVSRMRREVPGKAAAQYAKALGEVVEGEVQISGIKREGEGEEMEEGGERIVGLGERQEDVEKVMRRGVGELEGLEGITEVIARLEQAGGAVEVVQR